MFWEEGEEGCEGPCGSGSGSGGLSDGRVGVGQGRGGKRLFLAFPSQLWSLSSLQRGGGGTVDMGGRTHTLRLDTAG